MSGLQSESQDENVNLFEISNVYAVNTQQERLAIVRSDSLQNSKLNRIDIRSDFFAAKGVLTETRADWALRRNG